MRFRSAFGGVGGYWCALPVAFLWLAALPPRASALPPDFVDSCVLCDLNRAVGLAIAPDGRIFVAERDGLVWIVEDGVKAEQPLLDISEECLKVGDLGLVGFAIDPQFYSNGYIYLFYSADYHYVTLFGQPGYDPDFDANQSTIGRVTRYQCDSSTGFRTVLPGTRTILIGETLSTGIPITAEYHGGGGLTFGEDGSLLVGTGDGGYLWDIGGCASNPDCSLLSSGIIGLKEDVGAFRAQLIDSHNGKILRISPQTGNGLADNPFYDPAAPRAARSRVWALGARNPFRITVRPGSSHDRHTNAPGSIYIGDVGWFKWEEIHVSRGDGGENFGWPLFDGLEIQGTFNTGPGYYFQTVPNMDAPNPLAGTTPPGQFFCGTPYFSFRDLLVQDTLLPNPSFPNPCDSSQQVPSSLHRFVHTRPQIEFRHNAVQARTPIYNGTTAAISVLGSAGAPVAGASFRGECSMGGTWYQEGDFPEEYHDTYFQADWASGWIKNFVFDDQDQLVEVRPFAENGFGAIVAMAVEPGGDSIYYVDYDRIVDEYQLRRISYAPDNLPPQATCDAEPDHGPLPLIVQFSGSDSTDPDGHPLRFQWNFGDGTPPSRMADVQHEYYLDDITAQGTIVARVLELSPPGPLGSGSTNPEVIRDGDYPISSDIESLRQFDTTHGGDQGSVDWIGYTFGSARMLKGLVFLEGLHQPNGGWYDSLGVEVRVAGSWLPVTGITVAPPYVGDDGSNYDLYEFRFDPVSADGIRLIGDPGGSLGYISVGELRVLAASAAPPTVPTNVTATLTVTDDHGVSRTAQAIVSLNNTPPQVEITSPTDGGLYSILGPGSWNLTANISDDEHASHQLSCQWRTILHHAEHIHVEAFDSNCTSVGETQALGCAEELYYFEFALRVTDPMGLKGEASVFLYPDCSIECTTDLACRDGNSCTTDTCVAGFCEHEQCVDGVIGDLDCNDDVDTADVGHFAAAMTGPCTSPCLGGELPPCAERADVDADGDYDLFDYAAMQRSAEP